MKLGTWYPLERAAADDHEHLYRWPEKTRRMWKAQLKDRLGVGIRRFFKAARRDLSRIAPTPALFVFFPKDYDMSGHLASIRHVWANMQLIHYRSWLDPKASRNPVEYVGTGAVIIWTRHVLRKLAESSPLFRPIWQDIKDLPPDDCGIYLAEEPDPAWLASIQPDEHRQFAEFRDARQLNKLGLDLGEDTDEQIEQHMDAFFLMEDRKYLEAEALLKEILARWPGFWKADWDLVTCALAQEDPKRAYALVRCAQKKYPDALNFDRLGAECCVQLRDWRRAEGHLKRLWGSNPWDPNLMERYAHLAYARQDYALAVKLYEEGRENASLSPEAKFNYAASLGKINRAPEALVLFKELEKKNSKNAILLHHIGSLLTSTGRPLEGLDYCRRAVALDPHREGIWDSLGFTQLKIQKYPEAAKAFLKAVKLNPAFPDAWRHLLHAYHDGGEAERLEGAKAYVRRALPEQLARFEREKGTNLSD